MRKPLEVYSNGHCQNKGGEQRDKFRKQYQFLSVGGQECPKGQNGKESSFLRSEAGDPIESTVFVSLIKGFYAN